MTWQLTPLPRGRALAFTRGIASNRSVASILDGRPIIAWPRTPFRPREDDFVIGWGRKRNTFWARHYAARHGLPFIRLEDGFLRSLGLGKSGRPGYSVVVDDLGIYYDSGAPSRLSTWLDGPECLPDGIAELAQAALERIITAGLTKYNGLPEPDLGDLAADREHLLVIDQVAGDLSLAHGGAATLDLGRMVAAARADHPDAVIWVKTHPDVAAGHGRGLTGAAGDGIRFITGLCDPIPLLGPMSRVYVGTSLLGFEALLRGIPVTCFGQPFYAGWGCTDDRQPVVARQRRRTPLELFAAAYLGYSRYVDLETGAPCDILAAIDSLVRQQQAARANDRDSFCFGFRFWKRHTTRPLLAAPGRTVRFCRHVGAAERHGIDGNARIVTWGRRSADDVVALGRRTGAPIHRMEDGFLRSVGLGSDLIPPASLVLDTSGIYFDATAPSDLERLLNEHPFDPALRQRAARLRQRLVDQAFSKYNLERGGTLTPGNAPGQAVLLVPGQVEDDASIEFGCAELRSNLDLLAAVREARPDAWVVYKPHPDVVAGNRAGEALPRAVLELCDEVAVDVDITACLATADEVHTLTSLTGFEALLRGLPVVTYGRPFYAGWGLTRDRLDCPRRRRTLELDELVAGALILYPRYYDWRSGLYTTPERTLDRLQRERAAAAKRPRGRHPVLERQLRKFGYLLRGLWPR